MFAEIVGFFVLKVGIPNETFHLFVESLRKLLAVLGMVGLQKVAQTLLLICFLNAFFHQNALSKVSELDLYVLSNNQVHSIVRLFWKFKIHAQLGYRFAVINVKQPFDNNVEILEGCEIHNINFLVLLATLQISL